MANAKTNKTIKTNTEVKTKNITKPKVEKEAETISNEDKIRQLEEMNKELLQQIQLLMTLNSAKSNSQEGLRTEEFNPTRMIKVISLCSNKLNLAQGEKGEGKVYTFNKLGAVKSIPANILDDIVSSHLSLAEKGYFYICDEQFIKEHGLEGEYENLKTPEVMAKILEQDNKTFREILASCRPQQLKTILDIIIQKILDKEIKLEDLEDDGRANIINKVSRQILQENYDLRNTVEDLIELTSDKK